MDLYESILRLILLIDIQKSNWPKVTVLRNGLNELGKGILQPISIKTTTIITKKIKLPKQKSTGNWLKPYRMTRFYC